MKEKLNDEKTLTTPWTLLALYAADEIRKQLQKSLKRIRCAYEFCGADLDTPIKGNGSIITKQN